MKQCRGLTLIECIVVSAIIVVLVAILLPVLGRGLHAARVSASANNLRQMHANIMLYQSDWGGGGTYGDLAVMGLPNINDHAADLFGSNNAIFGPKGLWKSPCGLHPSFNPGGPTAGDVLEVHYIYRPFGGGDQWSDYSRVYQENALLFYDVNCDDHNVPYRSPLFDHRGLGILLSGQLIKQRKKGDMYDDAWWGSPPPL